MGASREIRAVHSVPLLLRRPRPSSANSDSSGVRDRHAAPPRGLYDLNYTSCPHHLSIHTTTTPTMQCSALRECKSQVKPTGLIRRISGLSPVGPVESTTKVKFQGVDV